MEKKNHEPFNIRSNALFVDFVGAKKVNQGRQEKVLNTYNNYFLGNDPSKYASECKLSTAVYYENIYNNIDVRYYTEQQQLKYDLIIKPGGNPNQILLNYKGAEKLRLDGYGRLQVTTSVGGFAEMIPEAYFINNNGEKQKVDCKFVVKDNIVNFKIANYDQTKTLVIDPVLIFATYTGSTTDNWGYTATYGPNGEGYGGGIVFGAGFPTNIGAFTTTYQGGDTFESGAGFDIGIIKYSANGANRLYATYIGGTANEQPHSLIADNAGNLVLAGRTRSTATYPKTISYGALGGWDIIITKISSNGTTLLGSIIIGGTGVDGLNIRESHTLPASSLVRNYGDDARSEVILDNIGNILLASCTQSTDFPTTAGVFQNTKSGLQDAVVIKANPNCTALIAASYFGGSGDDAAYVITQENGGGDYRIAGGTTSNNLPGDFTGVYQSTFQGGICDGYVAEISTNLTSLKKASYFGTVGDDQIYGIQFDRLGSLYLGGTSTANWPVFNAQFSNPGSKQFIGKVQPDLSTLIYSTVFGSANNLPNITPTAFLVDNCQNVYFSGWGGGISVATNYNTSGTNGMPTTVDGLRRITDGKDFYFFVLEKDAVRQLYGTFYGINDATKTGDHVDGGTSRFDKSGTIYQGMCADCGGNTPFGATNFTTAGSWSPTNRSSNCNLGFTKIAFNFAGVSAGVRTSIGTSDNDTIGCVPLTVDFRDTVKVAQSYEWDFGDGTGTFTSTTATFSHTYPIVGNYRVRLIAIDPLACIPRDTAYITISVRNDPAFLDFNPVKVPPCTNLTYRFTNLSVPPSFLKPFVDTSFLWDFGDGSPRVKGGGIMPISHTYPSVGNYNVKMFLIDTNYCNVPDSVIKPIRLADQVKAVFTTKDICLGDVTPIDNTSLGGITFNWNWGNGATSTGAAPNYIYPAAGNYTITLYTLDPNSCNLIDSAKKTIRVLAIPNAQFVYSPFPSQVNIPTTFINQSTLAISYKWFFGDGDSSLLNGPTHQYVATGIYPVRLIAYNSLGCTDTAFDNVQAEVLPLIDVPSAFSPNGDGVNDKVIPRGFGVSKTRFIIFNRWGQKVFETDQRNTGWDGFFKGKIQAQDVYAYTLEATLADGKVIKKSGDITLFR
jgi:gliding motility-associated-like protein